MTSLALLWMPILISTLVVFVVSSLIHTLSPWHKGDYPKLSREEEIMAALQPFAMPPGDYMVPRAGSMEILRSPEFIAKLNRGPVMIVTVLPNGMMDMRRNLGLWAVYLVIVSTLAALVAGGALPPGADKHAAFHFTAITSFIGYSAAIWQMAIWYRRGWGITFRTTVDGLIYGLLTGAVFANFWPVVGM